MSKEITEIDKDIEYYYSGDYVRFFAEVEGRPDLVIVSNGEYSGELLVVSKHQLQKKEDSYEWKNRLRYKEDLENITKKAQEALDTKVKQLADKVLDEALRALASRLKFNVMFGKGVNGATAAWGVEVSNELEKLVKEKTDKKIKEEKNFDF